MKVTINKSHIKGRVTVPSSKSMTIRALMCAALSRGESEILNPLICDDTNVAADVLEKIGVKIRKEAGVWRVTGGKFKIPTEELYCGESATTLRFMTALVSLLPGTIKLSGGPSLTQRPIRALVDALKMLGIKGTTAGKTAPPVTIQGGTFKGGTTEIPGNVSSQYISALLLIGSFAPTETIIRLTTPLTSRPYVLMTLWCLKAFGIKVKSGGGSFIVKRQRYVPASINIEGDWSSASYFLALGAVSEGGIQLENLRTSSLQGDRIMLDHLRNMGVIVRVSGNTITVMQSELKAINANLSDCIDLLPTMAVLAALAKGVSEFRGIQRARIKESDRVAAVKAGLKKMGVTVFEDKDSMKITGLKTARKDADDESEEDAPGGSIAGEEKASVVIDSYNDHRIAMAFAVMGVALGGLAIKGAECVAKTYPGFWETLKQVGGELKIDEQ